MTETRTLCWVCGQQPQRVWLRCTKARCVTCGVVSVEDTAGLIEEGCSCGGYRVAIENSTWGPALIDDARNPIRTPAGLRSEGGTDG